LRELGEARVIARGQPGETETGHVRKARVGLDARPTQGRTACEGEQGAGVSKAVCAERSGCGCRRWGQNAGRLALGIWRRSVFWRTAWTWAQAGHRPDASVAERCAGFLAPSRPYLLAPGFSQRHLQGRIGLGKGLG